jgi:hypothetical protein
VILMMAFEIMIETGEAPLRQHSPGVRMGSDHSVLKGDSRGTLEVDPQGRREELAESRVLSVPGRHSESREGARGCPDWPPSDGQTGAAPRWVLVSRRQRG